MSRISLSSYAERLARLTVVATAIMLFVGGCKPRPSETQEQESDKTVSAQKTPEFPKFSTEIKSLSAKQLAALGEKNSLPTEFVFPNSTYVQVVYPDRVTAVDNGDAAIDYISGNTFQIPVKGILKNAELAIFSRGFTFEPLRDAKTSAVLQKGYPSPVEMVYLKCKAPLDQKAVREEAFKDADQSKLQDKAYGSREVAVYPNALLVPLDQSGQTMAKIDDVSAGLCFPTEDSVVFMSGTSAAFESFLSDKKGDERGIAAQRLARIPMDNIAVAFQYDIDFSTPNAQLVQLPVPLTPELLEEVQKEVVAFQFMFDAATPEGNLFTLNVNVKTESGAVDLRKAIGTALMKTVDSIATAQKNNPSEEANATFEGLISILKSVQLNAEGEKVVASVKNTPENVRFIADGVKRLNDVRVNMELRQKYQVAEQTLLQFGSLFTRYSRENKYFPAPICSDDGTPLLSWRVAILPSLGGQYKELYDQFKLTEPWNSDSNIKLLDKMPPLFASTETDSPNKTRYLIFNSPETPFGRFPKGLKLQDVEDPYNTLSVVYAAASNAVEWTKPETFVFNPSKPTDSFGDYVCGITLMGELISSPCDDSEKTAKSLATLVFGSSQTPSLKEEDDAEHSNSASQDSETSGLSESSGGGVETESTQTTDSQSVETDGTKEVSSNVSSEANVETSSEPNKALEE